MPYKSDESYFIGFFNHSTLDYTFTWNISSIKFERYTIFYCIVKKKERIKTNGCKVNENDEFYGLKTITINSNETFYKLSKSMIKNGENYDFGISGDISKNQSNWYSTGIISNYCIFKNKHLQLSKFY